MFRGTHATRIDEKGRLKVPAEFKRELEENKSTRFYITSLDGNIAKIYPMEQWEEIERGLATISDFKPAKKKYLDRTNYYGQVVEMDGQGRLLMPALLRDAAELKGEVAVVGNLKYLEVRNMEAYRKQLLEQPFTEDDAESLAGLGI